mgnify:CR=1 FL=1
MIYCAVTWILQQHFVQGMGFIVQALSFMALPVKVFVFGGGWSMYLVVCTLAAIAAVPLYRVLVASKHRGLWRSG